jgi:two-component system, cell cycle sensor histidine kinase and response regulator CckA
MSANVYKQLGYGVLEAESGEAALEVCGQQQGKIDLVMTDLVMPGMGGRELAKTLTERFPGAGVLFTSGYTADSALRNTLLQAGDSFLEKPYTVAALAVAVQEALAKRSRNAETLATH